MRLIILFYLRLALYLVAVGIPLFHPAVVISYDAATRWLWFLFVPLQMHIAFFLGPPRLKSPIYFIGGAAALVISLFVVSGFGPSALIFVLAQILAFAMTLLVFRSRELGRPFAVLELFFVALILIRMLGFSRASETFAQASSGVTQLILGIAIGVFFFHGLVIYLASYREGIRKRSRRELALFLTIAGVIGLAAALFMPADFINHSVVLNDLKNPPDPDFVPLDQMSDGFPGGNLQSDRISDLERNGANGQGNRQNGEQGSEGEDESESQAARLQGIPSEQWDSRTPGRGGRADGQSQGESQGEQQGDGEGQGESQQYAVMVIASDRDPIYAAEAYYADFDEFSGFRLTRDQPLNDLTYLRLLETWNNDQPSRDLRRSPVEVYALSTISERVAAYEPRSIQPTIRNTIYHPFDYSYTSISAISMTTEREWGRVRELTSEEREILAPYLDVQIREELKDELIDHYESVIGDSEGYYGKLDAIIQSYGEYQYNIGFTDDVSVSHISDFLLNTRDGDCTEFSNATALLARLAGIPTRVVTGYLASTGLQTNSHIRGLVMLQEAIEPLQEYPLDSLYLVTTAHRHSWVQVFMPGYGWVDIETTATAIPPMSFGDPNNMDVVIPIINPEVVARKFQFPWLLALQGLLVIAAGGLVGAYLFRYGRKAYLSYVARGTSQKALRALSTLMLTHLASEGYPIKPPSETQVEYAEEHPEVEPFAELYTKLRFKDRYDPGEKEQDWTQIRDQYQELRRSLRRKGLVGFVKRVFTLRDLGY